MSKLNKYTLKGESKGEITVKSALLEGDAPRQMIKDYLVALRANARQWSANTKGRSEVSHSNKKPHKQKGTGNARQGTLAAPQCRGGGVVFGPKPKFNQHTRINKQEKQAAVRQLFAEKIKEKRVYILDDFSELKKPSTKTVWDFLCAQKIEGRAALFVGESTFQDGVSIPSDKHDVMKKSVRNIPRSAFVLAANVNGYDVVCAHNIVMTKAAFEEISTRLVSE